MSKYSRTTVTEQPKREKLDFTRMGEDILAAIDFDAILTDIVNVLDLATEYPDAPKNVAKGALKAACDRWSAHQREKKALAPAPAATVPAPADDTMLRALVTGFVASGMTPQDAARAAIAELSKPATPAVVTPAVSGQSRETRKSAHAKRS